ncbi:hypothetical protein [Symbiopectobacterium purcellii]|uniref:Uncharacterized protein n=1 Tax=Symbiopectobacterium purcellii TaxID=2871826 RepID=A0ABX9AQF6_9ENTR|nr:hypothetical protein [Symbiopectobacterium purcellii]QZN97397.1 hypothetical protein K6K13_08735 [Symbiopectobacterium purcellii]
MVNVNVKWLSPDEGGRQTPPPGGRYLSIARFPDDTTWQNNAWSVIFDLSPPKSINGYKVSAGTVEFMMDNAPKEQLNNHDAFEIYEGPHKVGVVYILER